MRKTINGYDIRQNSNLSGADLRGANLSGADLRGANLDFSCIPLWCGGQGVKVDSRLAKQIVLHALAFGCDDPEYARLRKEATVFCADSHRREDIRWK